METCTWNVIFMSMDVSYQDTANSLFLSNVIQLGKNFFIKDVEDSIFNNQLNITVFDFKSGGQVGTADVFKNITVNPSKKNALDKKYSINNFDCLNSKSYDAFFKEEITKRSILGNQKFIIVFLAHSFGAGFFFKPKNPLPSNGVIPKHMAFEYFTTIQLNTSIKKAIGRDKKIDCFIGLNCWLQSIETNILFSKTTNYLISSQQPLDITAVSYKQLFKDLVYTSEITGDNKIPLSDDITFSKFLYNCYQVYKQRLDAETRPIYKLDNFGLALTKPSLGNHFRTALHKFWEEVFSDTEKNNNQPLGQRNMDYWSYAAHFCADPSFSQAVNVIDATQFFLKLKTFYLEGSTIEIAIQEILGALRNLIVLNVSSPYMCSTYVEEYDLTPTYYIPFGVGIFIPKLLSVNLTEILKIFTIPKSGTTAGIPEPTEDFFVNVLSCIAHFHKGTIPYKIRTEMLRKLFVKDGLKEFLKP